MRCQGWVKESHRPVRTAQFDMRSAFNWRQDGSLKREQRIPERKVGTIGDLVTGGQTTTGKPSIAQRRIADDAEVTSGSSKLTEAVTAEVASSSLVVPAIIRALTENRLSQRRHKKGPKRHSPRRFGDSHHRSHQTSGPNLRCSRITLLCCMASSSLA